MKLATLRFSLALTALLAPPLAAQSLSWNQTQVDFTAQAGSSVPLSQKVRLINNTGGIVNYRLTTSTQPWIGVLPIGGTLTAFGSAEVTLSVDPTNYSPNTYRAQVVATLDNSSEVIPLNVSMVIIGIDMLATPASIDAQVAPDNSLITNVQVVYSDGQQREYGITVVTDGGAWLQVFADDPIVAPNIIKIQVNASGMNPGEVHTGEVRLVTVSQSTIAKTIPVRLTVTDRVTGFVVVPSQLEFLRYGGEPLPPQPVFAYGTGGRTISYDVVQPPNTGFLSIAPMRAQTPAVMSFQVEASALPSMPRNDKVTFSTSSVGSFVLPVNVNVGDSNRIYSIPQIADGGSFKTQITVVNNDKVAATVSLRFYKSNPSTRATTPWNPPLAGDPQLTNVVIPVGGSWTVQTTGTAAAVSVGWAEVVCSQAISGQAVFQLQLGGGRMQEAAVPINSLRMQRSYLAFDNTSGFVTSFAMVNLDDTNTARIQVAFRDLAGNLIKTDKLPDIPPRGHLAIELQTLFPYLAGLRGVADFWAMSGRPSLMGLRFNPYNAFTSFEAQQVHLGNFKRRSIPQIADGGSPAAAYRTTIFLVNNDAIPATLNLKFWRDQGTGASTPWSELQLEGGVLPDNIQIPVGGTVVLQTKGQTQTINQGWAEVVSAQWVSGYAVFRQIVAGSPDQEAAIPINVGTPSRQVIPFDNTTGFTTSVAVANLNPDIAANVNYVLRDAQGSRIIFPVSDVIPPNGHKAFRLIDVFPGIDGQKGTLEVSQVGGGEVSAVGLRFAASSYTSIKATSLP